MLPAVKRKFIPCLAAVALGVAPAWAGDLDEMGFTALWAAHPELMGAGQIVAQVEAGPPYQVSPGAGGYTGGIEYYDSSQPYGTSPTTFSAASGHADAVAANLFSTGGGGAPSLQKVQNFDAGYFVDSIVANVVNSTWQPVAIASPIVNQSFIFTTTDANDIARISAFYDAYANTYGTLFVNGLNNGSGSLLNAPAAMYNGIAVGRADGGHSGQAQLVAPGDATSFATPYVSAAAALLRQAAAAGDFQALPDTDATDARVLKVGLLNGATKPEGWTHTTTAPLDATYGSGEVNVKNSFDTLSGGQHASSSTVQTTHNTISTSATFTSPLTAPDGWDLSSLTANRNRDAVSHYFFDLTSQFAISLTATITWNSIVNLNAGTDTINNFDLVLVNLTTHSLVWSSISSTQNIEQIYLTDLAGAQYDLQVILRGNQSSSLSDKYALAWSWDYSTITAVPESDFAWVIGAAGFLFAARKRLAARRA